MAKRASHAAQFPIRKTSAKACQLDRLGATVGLLGRHGEGPHVSPKNSPESYFVFIGDQRL